MKMHPWMVVSGLLAFAMPWAACGGGNSSGTTTGAGGHHTTTTHSTTTTNTGLDCTQGGFDMACEPCVETSCCTEAAACFNDQDCSDCLSGQAADPSVCAMGGNAALDAFYYGCLTNKCNAECLPHSDCNPVTNAGCTTAGSACDLSGDGKYHCFDPPNDGMLCGACSNGMSGPFCAGTLHCLEDMNGGKCTRYCCDDGDCGGGGAKCDKTSQTDGVGVCLGGTDAGVDPACSAPTTAASNGSCFTGTVPAGGGG